MSEEPQTTGDQISEAAAPVVTESTESYSAGEQEPRQVPLDALQAERSERQKLQDELSMMKDHMSLMQANQRQQQAPKPKDDFDGMTDDDVLTVGEFKKALGKKEKQYQMGIQELRMTQMHPDYQETVTKYLPDVLKQNPGLRNTLENSQDFELAYYLARNSDSYKKNHKSEKKNADAERIVQNANRAGSLSSVGQTSPINTAKQYKTMSDADFAKTVQKNLGYF